ncbi:phosphatidylinositol N-acetylglucosaminyltransferase subunit C [Halteromyces radiatus]|uniref:phosphatidylinositol N-acetylglucosaminyltransferase subunit C n=1 Tax=Halteromyces radiatus TaxID=101107 RepID=UPI00221F0CA6|nr:phosphatidylinositol N-acetylglucosaminyltransferase subunit C [Halteromyces radiatus]KAI8093907.1 phosphatidylinositol N-acetylglucosaminyltransferase subunit C [Halteromyces radiatus]
MASSFGSPEYQYNPNNPPWRKLLWVKQNYPDNYVDDTFLDELQKNVNVREYDYWTMVYQSGIITQHISSIVIFIAIFINLQLSALSGRQLIWIGSSFTGLGYLFWNMIVKNHAFKRKHVLKSAVFFFSTLLGLSPILKTLTSQTSHDTIWAMTVYCFLANVLSHDYAAESRTRVKIPGSLSTNAAIFASVLLASRLDTNLDVFGLLSFAVEWFALFPIFRRYLQDLNPKLSIALTILMQFLCVILFIQISKAVVILYLLGFCFLTFVCPYWLIFIQKYKNEIHGPWDEARPRLQQRRRNLYRKYPN